MIDQQLFNFIKEHREYLQNESSKKEMKDSLLAQGWPSDVIDEAILQVSALTSTSQHQSSAQSVGSQKSESKNIVRLKPKTLFIAGLILWIGSVYVSALLGSVGQLPAGVGGLFVGAGALIGMLLVLASFPLWAIDFWKGRGKIVSASNPVMSEALDVHQDFRYWSNFIIWHLVGFFNGYFLSLIFFGVLGFIAFTNSILVGDPVSLSSSLLGIQSESLLIGFLWVIIRYINIRRKRLQPPNYLKWYYVVWIILASFLLIRGVIIPQYVARNISISNIKDELLISPLGNPIGIRLTYDVNFPGSSTELVEPVIYPEKGYDVYGPLNMYYQSQQVTGPDNKEQVWKFGAGVMKEGGVYHVIADTVPSYDSIRHSDIYAKLHQKCFEGRGGSYQSQNERLQNELAVFSGQRHFIIDFGSFYYPRRLQSFNTVTQNSYDAKVFYESYVKEGYSLSCGGDNSR